MNSIKKIGINGVAGRIGKYATYELVALGETIGAVNDLASTNKIVSTLSCTDGVHGKSNWNVSKIDDNRILINNNPVMVYHEKDPVDISWGNDVYLVCECTGAFTKRDAAERHFNKSHVLEDVVISAPGKGNMKMLVMGVNHTNYEKGDRVTSNASCTTKSLAVPLRALLDSGLSISSVIMNTVHAATNTQKPLDFLDEYGALDNIVSSKTGAATALGEVIPELKGKVYGFAWRVPTRDGSFSNVYLVADGKDLSTDYINKVFRNAVSDPRYSGRIDVYHDSEIGSPNIIGNTASAIIALSKTYFDGKSHITFVSGYDNELGSAMDLALLSKYILSK